MEDKVQICFKLYKLFLTKKRFTEKQLAKTFNVSSRTIRRYIEEMIISGITINSIRGRYGGWQYENPQFIKKLKR